MKYPRIIFLVIIATCWGCSNNSYTNKKVTLMLSWLPGAEHAFIYRALDHGYFKQDSIQITIEPSRGSKDVATALDLGTANFGLISGDYLVLARHKGIPIKGLLTLYHESPATIMFFDSLQIKSPFDLINKKVGVLKQSTTYPQFHAMLQKAGVSIDAVKEVTAVQGGTAQLVNGEIDALMHYTNYAPVMLRAKGYSIGEILMKNNGIRIYSTTLATTDEMITNNPELVQKVVNIFLRSLRESFQDFEGTLASLLHYNPELEENVQRMSLQRTNELILDEKTNQYGVGYMLREDWEATQNTLLECKQIQNKIDPRFFYDDHFIKKAKLQ